MKNLDIRQAIIAAGLKNWMVADCYDLHEANFSRLLRKELNEDQKKTVFKAIEQAKKKYNTK